MKPLRRVEENGKVYFIYPHEPDWGNVLAYVLFLVVLVPVDGALFLFAIVMFISTLAGHH